MFGRFRADPDHDESCTSAAELRDARPILQPSPASGRRGFGASRHRVSGARHRRRGLPRRSPIRRTASPSRAEHRRAKTDRLDTWLLKHSFLGRLRRERDYCSMAAIPSLEEEEAKRPNRERENLVGERTRIGNRIKSALARLGIRGFGRPCARPRSGSSGCPRRKSEPVPPNTLAELRRERARLRLLTDQIREIETARLQRLEQRLYCGVHPMVRLLARVRSLGIGTADRPRAASRRRRVAPTAARLRHALPSGTRRARGFAADRAKAGRQSRSRRGRAQRGSGRSSRHLDAPLVLAPRSRARTEERPAPRGRSARAWRPRPNRLSSWSRIAVSLSRDKEF